MVSLVCISTFTSSTVPAYSIPIRYVHEFCMMCLHVQFSEDMCTSFVFKLSLTGVWPMPTYSIPVGYVHKF